MLLHSLLLVKNYVINSLAHCKGKNLNHNLEDKTFFFCFEMFTFLYSFSIAVKG